MNTADVYADNIQKSQIANRILCNLDNLEAIEDERKEFRNWLGTFPESLEDKFWSQLEAWQVYNLTVQRNQNHQDTGIPTRDFTGLAWLNEILAIFEGQINLKNYDENLGQQ